MDQHATTSVVRTLTAIVLLSCSTPPASPPIDPAMTPSAMATGSSVGPELPRHRPTDVSNLAKFAAGNVQFWVREPVFVFHVRHSLVLQWDQIAEGGDVRTQDLRTANRLWKKGRWVEGEMKDMESCAPPDTAWRLRFEHPTSLIILDGERWIAAPEFSSAFLDKLMDVSASAEDEDALLATAARHFSRHIGVDGIYRACDHPLMLGLGAGVLVRGMRKGLL